MKNISFIGTGNMGGALAIAVSKNEGVNNMTLFNRTESKAVELMPLLSCEAIVAKTLQEAVFGADFIFLGVKPQQMRELTLSLVPILRQIKTLPVLITMAAGISINTILELCEGIPVPVIRIMPNTPCSIGAGCILYTCSNGCEQNSYACEIASLSRFAGEWVNIPESLIDIAGVITGCGVAYMFEIIQAMGDGAVLCGLDRQSAYRLSASSMISAARLLLETGKNPSVLKDAVTSPGGSTIAGLRILEKGAMRSTLIEATIASYRRNIELGFTYQNDSR